MKRNLLELSNLVKQAFSLKKEFKINLPKNSFSFFSTKTYVSGTQNNRLNEMVLLST